jgi:hypothetical protein
MSSGVLTLDGGPYRLDWLWLCTGTDATCGLPKRLVSSKATRHAWRAPPVPHRHFERVRRHGAGVKDYGPQRGDVDCLMDFALQSRLWCRENVPMHALEFAPWSPIPMTL